MKKVKLIVLTAVLVAELSKRRLSSFIDISLEENVLAIMGCAQKKLIKPMTADSLFYTITPKGRILYKKLTLELSEEDPELKKKFEKINEFVEKL